MSEDKQRPGAAASGSGNGEHPRSSQSSDPNRVRRRKKKKKSSGKIPSEFSSRVVTLILILLGVLFLFSLYYIVVNLNVKSAK